MENITNEQLEHLIDEFLILLNEHIEDTGKSPAAIVFDFSNGYDAFLEKHPVSSDIFYKIIKRCKSRNFIRYAAPGSGFRFMNLTEPGREKALQVMLNKSHKNKDVHAMHINNLTIHGSAQIGNNNIQNFSAVSNHVLSQIENSNLSADEKEKTKSLWQKVCDNPLLCSVLGGISSAIPLK